MATALSLSAPAIYNYGLRILYFSNEKKKKKIKEKRGKRTERKKRKNEMFMTGDDDDIIKAHNTIMIDNGGAHFSPSCQ